jgi:transcriptional regulator with XRE-family HTH domain
VRAAQVQPPRPDLSRALTLRQKMLGALLRQARLDVGMSLEMVAERAWTSPSLLEAYELGEEPIPLPDLEVLAGVLNRSATEFLDQRGPLGAGRREQRSLRDFQTLPPDLQAFVSKPINRPYLELALRLSEMSVDKLRAVAEGLLEITL